MTLRWRDVLDWAVEASTAGMPITAQVLSRAIGVMLGRELTLDTFYTCPSYARLARLQSGFERFRSRSSVFCMRRRSCMT